MTNYLIALSAIALVTFSANAQTKRNAPGDQQPYHEKMRGKHMHRSGNMMKDLNFSNAQKEQLKHIRSEYHNKINQLEQNKSITLQDYKLKKAELQKEQKAKVESLLTAEQKEKLAKATEENTAKREMMEQKRVDKMKSQLNLTDAQVSKLQSQHEIFKSQAKAIKENAS
jgi:Spy/CpxP family protein refolding chaperone